MAAYADMLALAASGGVPRHAAEKKLASLLDHLAASTPTASAAGVPAPAPAPPPPPPPRPRPSPADGDAPAPPPPPPGEAEALLERAYAATLDALGASNERLAFRARLRLAALWLARGDLAGAERALAALRASCGGIPGLDAPGALPAADGGAAGAGAAAPAPADDARRGTQLLDVLALEVQVAAARGDGRRARAAHRAAAGALATAIPHPRVMGAIKEAGGRAALADRDWAGAATSFFEAFRAYDEAGVPARTRCLRGSVLASLLMGTGVDPFEAVEARPYRGDPEVAALAALADAHRAGDAASFGRAVAAHARSLAADPVIAAHLGDLTAAVRGAAALRAVAPYGRVRLAHVAAELGISPAEAEGVLAGLILAGRLAGRIDQEAGLFEVVSEGAAAAAAAAAAASANAAAGAPPPPDRAASLAAWAGAVGALHAGVVSKMSA